MASFVVGGVNRQDAKEAKGSLARSAAGSDPEKK